MNNLRELVKWKLDLLNDIWGNTIELITKADNGAIGVQLNHRTYKGRIINRGQWFEDTGACPGDKASKGQYNAFKGCTTLRDVERIIENLPAFKINHDARSCNWQTKEFEDLKTKYSDLCKVNKGNYDAAVMWKDAAEKEIKRVGKLHAWVEILLSAIRKNNFQDYSFDYVQNKFEELTGTKIEMLANSNNNQNKEPPQQKKKNTDYCPEDDPNSIEGMTRKISEEKPLLKRGTTNLSILTESELDRAINMLVVDSGMLPNTPQKCKRGRNRKRV